MEHRRAFLFLVSSGIPRITATAGTRIQTKLRKDELVHHGVNSGQFQCLRFILSKIYKSIKRTTTMQNEFIYVHSCTFPLRMQKRLPLQLFSGKLLFASFKYKLQSAVSLIFFFASSRSKGFRKLS